MNQEPQPHEPQKPVAYDSEGRPLYAAPPAPAPQPVYMSRAVTPATPPMTEEVKARHAKSVALYPTLNLSEAEYVISAVRRHPIGLAAPIGLTVLVVSFIVSLMINSALIIDSMAVVSPPAPGLVWGGGLLLIAAVLIGGYIAVWIYMSNRFFLTNESVIQEIQTGLFARHEQTVSLANIEDASFKQHGLLQTFLDYGSIRLSTEGDETTYRFSYVSNPKEQIAILNNAVEAFKNGRPIQHED